jgi:PPOX class probable F420-dependent enzyme
MIVREESLVRMDGERARERFAGARVARLATVSADGRPHLVPIVFAVEGDTVYSAVDRKPKRSAALARLTNIRADPRVEVVVDRYDEDWTRLWWVRAAGRARAVEDPGERDRALALLAAKYDAYRAEAPAGPVIAIDLDRWSGWDAATAGSMSAR